MWISRISSLGSVLSIASCRIHMLSSQSSELAPVTWPDQIWGCHSWFRHCSRLNPRMYKRIKLLWLKAVITPPPARTQTDWQPNDPFHNFSVAGKLHDCYYALCSPTHESKLLTALTPPTRRPASYKPQQQESVESLLLNSNLINPHRCCRSVL